MSDVAKELLLVVDNAGAKLSPEQWIELLEILHSDIDVRLEAAREELENG